MYSKVTVVSFLVVAVACWAECTPGREADSVALVAAVRSAQSQNSRPAGRFLRFRKIPTAGTVCIRTVQNLSGRTLDMRGVDHELAAQIGQTAYRVGKGPSKTCDATVDTQIIQVQGPRRVNSAAP
jgi:hypothetical protein